ncbi:MAG: MFS transporter [Anaerolineae bacterium]|jgi:MFS family permease|nr:MFS transporter [Chloroflexota bacterium]
MRAVPSKPDVPRTADAVEAFVRRNLGWNMRAGIADLVFFAPGMAMVSNETVIPLLLTRLGATSFLLGLITALTNAGVMLPQLIGAGVSQTRRYKRPISMLFGMGERLPYLLIGLALWLWGSSHAALALAAYVLLRTLSSVSVGIIIPAWYTLIAKTIPTRRRGLFLGLGRGLGALLGVGAALLSGHLLDTQPWPLSFALCFGLAFAFMSLSWLGLAVTREPPDLTVAPRTPLRRYLAELPGVLRRNPNFSRYILARSLTVLGSMALGFIIVYGTQRLALRGTQIGQLTATISTAQAAMYLLWGLVADRFGHKRVLCAGAACMAAATLLARLTPSLGGLFVAFALTGAGVAAEMTSSSSIVLEFARPEEQPTYVGLCNTLTAPFRALAPILGGALAGTLGYPGMFTIATAMSLLGLGTLALRVREPRTMN